MPGDSVSRTRTGWVLAAVCSFACAVSGVSQVGAECMINNLTHGGSSVFATPTAPIGQSFVACQDGIITNVAVGIGQATLPQVRLGLQPGTDLQVDGYSLAGVIQSGASRIRFTPVFPVTKGMVYSLSMAPVTGSLMLPRGASYTEGSLIAIVQGVSTPQDADMEFAVTITDAAVPAAAATWGRLKSIYR